MKAQLKDQPQYSFLLATGSYDRYIRISKVRKYNSNKLRKENFEILFVFKHKFKIHNIDWDPFHSHRFLASCSKHVTV